MDKTFTLLVFIALFTSSRAQTFNGTGGAITNDGVPTYFPLNVSGLNPTVLNSSFGIETVCININHPADEELYIFLQSPSGMKVELSDGGSCTGNSYVNTCLNSSAGTSVTLAIAPFTGTFRPMGYLGRFNNGEIGNGIWNLIVKDWLGLNANSGNVVNWSITFGASPSPPVTFTSSNLPIVILNTNNQEITDSDLIGTMGIIDNGAARNYVTDGWNNYNGRIRIHTHGHSTLNYEKKSFTVETEDAAGNNLNVSLLGMPPENDWVLNAEYADKTLIRNPLNDYLWQQMGHYAPRCRNVEVILNNEYYGVYTLMEKIKRDANRVDISKLTTTDNTYPEITGGYILKIDYTDAPGWYSYLPGYSQDNSHFYYQYDYPKDSDITLQQQGYIHSVLDSFEIAMNSSNMSDPATGYPHFIILNSFADFFIINELGRNADAYRLSTYLCKESISHGGKISIGPVWDCDICFFNANYADAFNTWGWQYLVEDSVHPAPTWWLSFNQDAAFNNMVQCRWSYLRQNVLKTTNINAYIDAQVAQLAEAEQRNFIVWPVMGAHIHPNPQNETGATYQTEVADLKNWVVTRSSWLDSVIPVPMVCDTASPPPTDTASFVLLPPYPNPFAGDINITYRVDEASQVKIELQDMLGKNMALLYSAGKTQGIYTQKISAPFVAAGIYMMKLSINNQVYLQKMMKLSQ